MVVRRRTSGGRPAVTSPLSAAYSATGGAWQRGPGRIYDRLAEVIVDGMPLVGASVLDVGAGTGAATRAALAAGAAAVVAVDSALGMLTHDATSRPPAAVADALALPFADATFDAAVAAFSLNHLTDPEAGLREMVRVTRPGGVLVASSYATDDIHPARDAVEAALEARGWVAEDWYVTLRKEATPRMATVEACDALATAVGLDATVEAVRVPFPTLDAYELVASRIGMAQHAPFVATLSGEERHALEVDAVARLRDDAPPLVRAIVVIRATRP